MVLLTHQHVVNGYYSTLLDSHTDDGSVSAIGLIHNCTFERNSVDESGAAVSVSSPLFGNGSEVPSVTFNEW